jgi:tetratricopeptide (TPR) repeat protein
MLCLRTAHIALLGTALAVSSGIATPQHTLRAPSDGAIQQESSGTITAPQQLRRVEPPSPLSNAVELEKQGDQLRAQKLYADSIDYYAAALKKSGTNSSLHNKSGIAYLQMFRPGAARHEFERALKLDRGNAEATNNLGATYYMEQKYKAAIRNYEKAIKLEPDSASFHSNLGTAYFSRKEYEKAYREYGKALSLDPEIFERHSNSGIAAHMSSPTDRARYSYVIARMYARMHDADRCLQYLKKAQEEGYAVGENFARDREFDGYRKDPRFLMVLAKPAEPLPN